MEGFGCNWNLFWRYSPQALSAMEKSRRFQKILEKGIKSLRQESWH